MEQKGGPEGEHQLRDFARHTETGETFLVNSARYEDVDGLLRRGVYRHYKSTPENLRYYAVEQVVYDTHELTHLVIYGELDGGNDVLYYARPLDMFTDDVLVGKGKIPRFRYIGNLV